MTRSFFLFIPFSCLLALCVSGCQVKDTVKTSSRQANLFVRYLADTQEFKGQATFQEGPSADSLKGIQITGGVAFMGSNMRMRSLSENTFRYSHQFKSEYITPAQFSLTWPNDKEASVLTLGMTAIQNFTIKEASLSKGIEITINEKLKEGESVVLFFSDENQQARQIEKIGPTTTESLLFSPSTLIHLEIGQYDLYLVKKSKQSVLENNTQVTKELEYYTSVQKVTIK